MIHKEDADRHRIRVVFDKGDPIWVYLRKERFPISVHHKLKQRKIGSFKVGKIDDNVYCVELPTDMIISNVFNVADFIPYYEKSKHMLKKLNWTTT